MAILPIPTEVLVIPLVASQSLNPVLVACIGAVGSAIGALIDYYLGVIGFSVLDSKFALTKRVAKAKRLIPRVAKYGLPGLLIVGSLIPFAVLKPVIISAGAVKYDRRIFIVIIVLSSFVRYFADASVGSLLSLLAVYYRGLIGV
jgi:membrane protein YqaA with SNARE-associated domain